MQQQGKRNFHCGERHREDIRGEQIRSGGDASYNQDSSIQPDGWFVQLYDEDWDYAVWITEDKNRIHFVRGGEAHPLEFISEQEMKEIIESEEILILPRHWLRSSWG